MKSPVIAHARPGFYFLWKPSFFLQKKIILGNWGCEEKERINIIGDWSGTAGERIVSLPGSQ